MLPVAQVLLLGLAVLAMVPALAHALEMPGKRRLPKETYLAVQAIYYPGFTVAGASEPLAVIVAAIVMPFLRPGSVDFWLHAVAFLGLAAMHAVYWIFTHPVNRVWLEKTGLDRASRRFFAVGAGGGAAGWTRLRDRWEYSHVVRAVLAACAVVALMAAVATDA